ncbi:MAG TPA: tetratricopeptide repeat protein [Pirellulales bacterium]|nr:tetratricopeptide repeat protein [Pirellulales bacterium]
MAETDQEELFMARLLAAVERLDEGSDTQKHPDEETLALFVAGALGIVERESMVAHLDRCAICRQTASALLRLSDDEAETWGGLPRPSSLNEHLESDGLGSPPHSQDGLGSPPHNQDGLGSPPHNHDGLGSPPHNQDGLGSPPHGLRITWFALAASLLLAVGLVWGTKLAGRNGAESETYRQVAALVVDGKFDEADRAVAEAEHKGLVSDRLKSLHAEATRRIPDPIALAYAGRLSDFGYEPGGIVARDMTETWLGKGAKPALEQLRAAGSSDLEVPLNRGHALLTLGRSDEAQAEFDAAIELAPNNALAWLGRGLAQFMLDRFAAAADDFRKSLQLDPNSVAAKMNLAMALDELGKREEAMTMWRSLQGESLTDADRKLTDRALQELKDE